MDSFLSFLINQLTDVADDGLGALSEKLSEIANDELDPVKTFLLNRTAALLQDHGTEAIKLAADQFGDLLEGKHLNPAAVRKLPMHERGALIAVALRKELDAKALADAICLDIGAALREVLEGFAG